MNPVSASTRATPVVFSTSSANFVPPATRFLLSNTMKPSSVRPKTFSNSAPVQAEREANFFTRVLPPDYPKSRTPQLVPTSPVAARFLFRRNADLAPRKITPGFASRARIAITSEISTHLFPFDVWWPFPVSAVRAKAPWFMKSSIRPCFIGWVEPSKISRNSNP